MNMSYLNKSYDVIINGISAKSALRSLHNLLPCVGIGGAWYPHHFCTREEYEEEFERNSEPYWEKYIGGYKFLYEQGAHGDLYSVCFTVA